MRIIVLKQLCPDVLIIQTAVDAIDPLKGKSILYFKDYNPAFSLMRDGSPTLIISGSILSDGYNSAQLARCLKIANPNIAFFLYSVFSRAGSNIDGIIVPSGADFKASLVARILTESYADMSIPEVVTKVREMIAADN